LRNAARFKILTFGLVLKSFSIYFKVLIHLFKSLGKVRVLRTLLNNLSHRLNKARLIFFRRLN